MGQGLKFSILATLLLGMQVTAAEPVLGVVTQVDGQSLQISFGSDSGALPASMLAIYGPGKVEKHPLTGDVILEQRQLIAKAQVLERRPEHGLLARLTWIAAEASVQPGADAVPTPSEATPDAPPVLTAALPVIAAQQQQSVRIVLPIADPEGLPITCHWRLRGPQGRCGSLHASTTGEPAVQWTAPAEPLSEDIVLVVEARDAQDQLSRWQLPLQVQPLPEAWRQRQLQPFAQLGSGHESSSTFLARGPAGDWWTISDGRELWRLDAGWKWRWAIPTPANLRFSSPLVIVPRGEEIYVLDSGLRAVTVLATDGALRRQIGGLRSPTDLVVSSAGEVIVADQAQGGIFVYEADGLMRCRLGQVGGSDRDSFSGLARLALDHEDTLYALDTSSRLVHSFDRFHRRRGIIDVQSSKEVTPIDLAVHPLGLLVLLSDGRIQVFGESGHATRALESLTATDWFPRLWSPSSISVDGLGDIFVTFPHEGLIARYDRQGRFTGVRGASLRSLDRAAIAGDGRMYGLREREVVVDAFDVDGWLVQRFGGRVRDGGLFEAVGPMALSPDGKYLCIIDPRRLTVTRYDLSRPQDRPLTFGQRGKSNGQFEEPVAIALDDRGRAYVADAKLHRVAVFNVVDGAFLQNVGRYDRGRTPTEIQRPELLTVSADGSELYVYDSRRSEIMKFAVDHAGGGAGHVTNGGGRGRNLGQFSRPVGLACDGKGLLYVLDSGNRNLQVIDFRGNNAVAILAVDPQELGLRSYKYLSTASTGITWVASPEQLLGLRWQSGR